MSFVHRVVPSASAPCAPRPSPSGRRPTKWTISSGSRRGASRAGAVGSGGATRRAARAGQSSGVREEVRRYGWENGVETFLGDLRYAASPANGTGLHGVAILTLGLGIGGATAIFSAVDHVLIRPLPYPHAQRILAVWDTREDGAQLDIAYGTARELAARARSLEHLAVMKPWQPTLLGAAEPERLEGQQVGADYFEVLGSGPRSATSSAGRRRRRRGSGRGAQRWALASALRRRSGRRRPHGHTRRTSPSDPRG